MAAFFLKSSYPFAVEEAFLTRKSLLVSCNAHAARWTLPAVTEFADINLQLSDGAAQSIAVHSQLARCAALIPLVLFEHSRNKALFEFSDRFGIENVALVHLLYERF